MSVPAGHRVPEWVYPQRIQTETLQCGVSICFIPLLENDAVAAINELIRQFDTLKMIYGRLRKVVEER